VAKPTTRPPLCRHCMLPVEYRVTVVGIWQPYNPDGTLHVCRDES